MCIRYSYYMLLKYFIVQVLSTTVANALKVQGLPHTASTITFIEYVDMFFDCLNVSSLHDGQKKRKPALYPYRDVDDWRFTVRMKKKIRILECIHVSVSQIDV